MAIARRPAPLTALLLEGIHPDAGRTLRAAGFHVRTVEGTPTGPRLKELLRGAALLGVRSRTLMTRRLAADAGSLLAVGSFCVGTGNVDLDACADSGIAVFNAPYSNTRSVAELVIGELIMLRRGAFEKCRRMHAGWWDKSSAGAREIRGKRLGIIGYGNIGSQVGILAEALGMEVHYYDVREKLSVGNARRCRSMGELLRKADAVTLHVDDAPRNAGLIGDREFRIMKPGILLVNASRGRTVDLEALARHLRGGRVAGAGIDVFPKEPAASRARFRSSLAGLPNVIMTPHIGGSTLEAQRDIAACVTEKLRAYARSGDTTTSVNFPQVQLPVIKNFHRILHVHRDVPGVLSQINSLLAQGGINIAGQYLKTRDRIGYAITDIARQYDRKTLEALRAIPETVRLRVLY